MSKFYFLLCAAIAALALMGSDVVCLLARGDEPLCCGRSANDAQNDSFRLTSGPASFRGRGKIVSERDAITKMKAMQLREGLNLVDENPSGIRLFVVAKPGKRLEFVMKDRDGNRLRTTMSKKETTCWECGVDKDGNTHCWKVPCPDIVGPWNPGKVSAVLNLRSQVEKRIEQHGDDLARNIGG